MVLRLDHHLSILSKNMVLIFIERSTKLALRHREVKKTHSRTSHISLKVKPRRRRREEGIQGRNSVQFNFSSGTQKPREEGQKEERNRVSIKSCHYYE